MLTVIVFLAGLGLGGALRIIRPGTSARGAILTAATAALFGAYSPAAAIAGPWPEIALDLALGLVIAGAIGGPSGVSSRRQATVGVGGLVVAFFTLALVVTRAHIPAAFVSQAQFATLAVGAFLTSRASSERERTTFLRGLVAVATLESSAAVWESIALGHPGFWDYTLASDDPAGVLLPNPFLGDGILRMAGTTGHPIVLAFLVALALVIVVTRGDRLLPSRLLRTGVLTLLGAGVVVAGTRSSVVALVAVLGYLVMTSDVRHRLMRVLVTSMAGGVVLAQLAEALLVQVGVLVESGSYTNRAGSIEAVPALLTERPALEVVFGSGWASEGQLLDRGFLNQNGFGIVDNQLITTLATNGVAGLALFIAIGVVAWRRADRAVRAVLIVVLVMAFSFDFMRWAAIVVVLFSLLAPRRGPTAQPSDHRTTEGAPLAEPIGALT